MVGAKGRRYIVRACGHVRGALLQRRERRAAALCRRVLQLIRAAPRAEGTLSAPASPAKTWSAPARLRSARGRRYRMMPDGRRQGSKVYCPSLRPRERRSVVEALAALGESTAPRHCVAECCSLSAQPQRRKVHCLHLSDPQRRRVLQLIRAAPGVEGAALMPDGQRQRSKA